MKAIEFQNIWQMYNIKFIEGQKVSWENVWALEDVSFSVGKGEVLGIIGQNGAGKSTILKLISGMLSPDKGKVSVQGRISMLMELGAGFNPEFTGRENIYLNAQIYGVAKEEIEEKIEAIITFADLGRFIDAPLKYYSQGMYARLGFSLAIHVDPDILLVDDILSVGDEEFQYKCAEKIFDLKRDGKTIVVVSHSMHMIEQLCDKVIFLDKGKTADIDIPRKVISRYVEGIGEKEGIAVLSEDKARIVFNNGKVFISNNGISLTKGQGGHFVFLDKRSDLWVSSFNLRWKVLKRGDDAILAEASSGESGLKLELKIEIAGGEVRFKVEASAGSKDKIGDLHFDLFLFSDYSRYFLGDVYRQFLPFSCQMLQDLPR